MYVQRQRYQTPPLGGRLHDSHVPPQSQSQREPKEDLLKPNDMVKNRWRVLHKIGGGGFGEIYVATDTENPSEEETPNSADSGNWSLSQSSQSLVAIKAESNHQPKQMLRMEVSVLRRLTHRKDICELLGCGKNNRINYIVMTLQVSIQIRKKRWCMGPITCWATCSRHNTS